jgi:hypothetical protein
VLAIEDQIEDAQDALARIRDHWRELAESVGAPTDPPDTVSARKLRRYSRLRQAGRVARQSQPESPGLRDEGRDADAG